MARGSVHVTPRSRLRAYPSLRSPRSHVISVVPSRKATRPGQDRAIVGQKEGSDQVAPSSSLRTWKAHAVILPVVSWAS